MPSIMVPNQKVSDWSELVVYVANLGMFWTWTTGGASCHTSDLNFYQKSRSSGEFQLGGDRVVFSSDGVCENKEVSLLVLNLAKLSQHTSLKRISHL